VLKLLRAALRFVLITGATLVIVIALFTGLLRLGLPYASTYKQEVQGWVSNYLRAPVEIGTMNLGWRGLRPHITLDDVALASGSRGNVNVTLEQIELDFNLFKSLYDGELNINNVTIVGANLSLEYFGNSRFEVRSSPFASDKNQNTAEAGSVDVPSWLFNARRVSLLESRVRLLDRERGINYQIDNLNVRAENDGDFHRLRVDLQLPEQLGKTLEIGVDLNGSSSALQLSRGRFYVNATDLELQNWMNIWPDRPVTAAGVSDFQVWGEWRDRRLQSLRGRLDANHLAVVAGGDAQAAELDDPAAVPKVARYPALDTDFTWRRQSEGWRLEVDNLAFEHAGKKNQVQGVLISLQGSGDAEQLRVSGQGEQLDVGALARLLATLDQVPALAPVARYATGARVRGDLAEWKLDARLQRNVIPRVDLQADFRELSMNAFELLPGVGQLTGAIDLRDNKGTLVLDSKNLVLRHQRVFPEPLEFERLSATFDIDLDNPARLLAADNIRIQDEGFAASTRLLLQRNDDGTLGYQIDSEYSLDDVKTARQYLPLGVMRSRLIKWLTVAPQAGVLKNGTLSLRGRTGALPSQSENEHFKAAFAIEDATLKFRPGWPALTDAAGTLQFTGESLRFNLVSGQLAGTSVIAAEGFVSDFQRPVLELDSQFRGEFQAMLDFANDGPLSSVFASSLARTRGSGDVVLNVNTRIPLRPKKFRLADEVFSTNGELTLTRNRLRFDDFSVDLRALQGKVAFSESGLRIKNLKARYFDESVTLNADMVDEAGERRTDIRIDGLFHANRVLEHYGLPLAGMAQGPSRWRVHLQLPQGHDGKGVRLTLASDLVGTTVTLPAPLAKGAGTARAITVAAVFTAGSRQRWDIHYDSLLQARLQTRRGAGMQSLTMVLGGDALQNELPQGIHISGRVNALSFDGWIRAINTLIDESSSPGKPRPLQPVYADIRAEQLLVGEQAMGSAHLRVNTDDNNINAVLENQHLRGNIRFPRNHWEVDKPVRARVAYVDREFFQALSSSRGGDGKPLDPRKLPRLEAHIAKLQFGSINLNNIGLRTQPSVSGLSITALGFANDSSQVVGEGFWHLKDPQQVNPALANEQTSQIDLKFQSDNIGKVLASMGNSEVMAEGRGSLSVLLAWDGAVYKPDLASLDGKVTIRFKDGRLLRVEPGAAKLIGLFVLQEIPRRLSLDFRDVVRDGLDFGRITGDITVEDGIATTHLLRLEGPIGVVDVTGVSDLQARTLDQKVEVLPRVSAALPILGLLSGGATAGISALLATPVLKKLGIDFDRIGLTEYSVQGSWESPTITRLQQPERRDFSQSRD